jgi:glycosyltransferase involved in cell wall biosynthesis
MRNGPDFRPPISGHLTAVLQTRRDADVQKTLSVVVPCLNEEGLLLETNRRLTDVLEQLPFKFEVVYVDDGSTDATGGLLLNLAEQDERIRVVRLSRNFGHQVAITAGIEHSSGDAVVVIDADLQDPPEVILDFVKYWMSGYDVVYGSRTHRDGETAFKIWTARLFYRCIDRLSETRIPLDTGDFRLMDRRVVNALLAMPERDRFVRGMVSWLGFSQTAVPYRRAPRPCGDTKYSFVRMFRFAMDATFSFSIVPLRLATWLGFAASAIAVLGVTVAVVERLLGVHGIVKGWASMVTAVLFLGGVQLICIGIIGEYVGRIYGETKRRPLYVVRERAGFREHEFQVQDVRQRLSAER